MFLGALLSIRVTLHTVQPLIVLCAWFVRIRCHSGHTITCARNRIGIGLSFRPPRLHKLAESIPRNRFLGSLKVKKFGLHIRVVLVTYSPESFKIAHAALPPRPLDSKRCYCTKSPQNVAKMELRKASELSRAAGMIR